MNQKLYFRDLSDFRFYKEQLAKFADEKNLPTECTKYEFVKAVKSMSIEYYNRLLQAYNTVPEVQFYWNTVNELDRTNEDFIRLTNVVKVTDEEIIEIFRRVAIDRLEKPWLK